jgi:hypothetical protein
MTLGAAALAESEDGGESGSLAAVRQKAATGVRDDREEGKTRSLQTVSARWLRGFIQQTESRFLSARVDPFAGSE